MKISHLFSVSLVAATAWADSTYAFYAEVEDEFKPLQVNQKINTLGHLFWEESSIEATKFSYKDGIATSIDQSNPGNIVLGIERGLEFSQYISGTKLILEKETNRLLNHFYYSCENGTIHVIEDEKKNEKCFPARIYFQKLDRANGDPVKKLHESKEKENTPHVFYVKGEDYLEPLYTETDESGGNVDILHLRHGKTTVAPVEFVIKRDFAFTKSSTEYEGYAEFSVYDFRVNRNGGDTLGLTENGKVSARRLFSCKDPELEDRRIVSDLSECSDWTEVDLYLLPPDHTTGKPQKGSFRPQNDDMTPRAFFFKQNEAWVALSFKEDENANIAFAVIPEMSEKKNKPIQFSLKYNTAVTQNTSYPGFAGYGSQGIVFGPSIRSVAFDLDNEMKILYHHFYINKDRSISVDYPQQAGDPRLDLYLLPLDRTTKKSSDRSDIPVDDDETKVSSVSSDISTMTGTPTFSVSSSSDIPESSFRTMSDVTVSSIPSVSEIPKSSDSSMSHIPETSIQSMSNIPETSARSMSDVPVSAIPSVSEIPETSVSTMSGSSQSSVSNMAKSSDSPVSTIAGASSSSSVSHASRSSPSMSAVTGETSIDESSKWTPTTLTRETTTTATICTECQAASTITEWNTHTNFVTDCPERTTITFSKCNNGCYLSTTTVTSATTVTCPGVCIIPTTIIVNGPAETDNVGHFGPKDTVKSPSNVDSPAETVKVGEGSQNDGADIVAAGGSAQKGGEDIRVAEGSSPKIPVGSPSSSNSPNRIGKVEDSSLRQGDSDKQSDANKEGNGSNSPKPKTDIASGEKATDSNKASNGSNRPKPKSGNSDTTTTQTLTDTATAPSVSSFNGASKNAIGACVLGFAALLL